MQPVLLNFLVGEKLLCFLHMVDRDHQPLSELLQPPVQLCCVLPALQLKLAVWTVQNDGLQMQLVKYLVAHTPQHLVLPVVACDIVCWRTRWHTLQAEST